MRISLYLTEKEYVAAKRAADKANVSLGFILRLALRNQLGLPVGESSRVGQHDTLSHLRSKLDSDSL